MFMDELTKEKEVDKMFAKYFVRNLMIVVFFLTWFSVVVFQEAPIYYSVYAVIMTIIDADIILKLDKIGL